MGNLHHIRIWSLTNAKAYHAVEMYAAIDAQLPSRSVELDCSTNKPDAWKEQLQSSHSACVFYIASLKSVSGIKQLHVAYLDPQREQLLWTLFQAHTSYLPLGRG